MARHHRWVLRCWAGSLTAACAFLTMGAHGVNAHPLGNFSVNHAHNFTFEPGRVVDRAIVDYAEIPTAQAEGRMDLDGDGAISESEFDARGTEECAAVTMRSTLTIDAEIVRFLVVESSFTYQPGQAGLPIGRVECLLQADADLTVPRQISFIDATPAGRVGWREINARGDGVLLIDSSVPEVTTTDDLRTYPEGLLESPLDVTELQLSVTPGSTVETATTSVVDSSQGSTSIFQGGPLADLVDRISGRFNEMVGRRDLTLGVGTLAVALAMVLGASHALLPGHGKTVMAAYIAGRQGSSRDAFVVGATVTLTHTGGVLLLGLALTVSSSLAGETVLGWLGVTSGLVITALGGALLLGAIRHRIPAHGHRHSYGSAHHHHGHDHGHDHGHHREHLRGNPAVRLAVRRASGSAGTVVARSVISTLDRDAARSRVMTLSRADGAPTSTALARRPTTVVRPRAHRPQVLTSRPEPRVMSRRGLVGMGVAGGLVPSPSALVVLLSAIALGRTAFGVILVIGYGIGMAGTLTLAGLLLVRVRDRYQRRAAGGPARAARLARRWTKVMPYATALLVVIVGLGIAVRGLASV